MNSAGFGGSGLRANNPRIQKKPEGLAVKYHEQRCPSNMAEKTLGWLQRVLLPELSEMKGEVKAVHSEIKRLDGKVDSLRNEMNTRFEAVDSRFESVDRRFEAVVTRIDGLEKRLDVADRLAKLESEVSILKARSVN